MCEHEGEGHVSGKPVLPASWPGLAQQTHTNGTETAFGDGITGMMAQGTPRSQAEGILEAKSRRSCPPQPHSPLQRLDQSWVSVIISPQLPDRLSPPCGEGPNGPNHQGSTLAGSPSGRGKRSGQLHPLPLGPNSREWTQGRRYDSQPLLFVLACKFQWPNLPGLGHSDTLTY